MPVTAYCLGGGVFLSASAESFAAEFDFAFQCGAQAAAHCFAVAVERTRKADIIGGVVCTENASFGINMLQ